MSQAVRASPSGPTLRVSRGTPGILIVLLVVTVAVAVFPTVAALAVIAVIAVIAVLLLVTALGARGRRRLGRRRCNGRSGGWRSDDGRRRHRRRPARSELPGRGDAGAAVNGMGDREASSDAAGPCPDRELRRGH